MPDCVMAFFKTGSLKIKDLESVKIFYNECVLNPSGVFDYADIVMIL